MRIRTPANEDGERGRLEGDLTVVEARAMARDLETACEMYERGQWRVGA